jgi:PmbA protein
VNKALPADLQEFVNEATYQQIVTDMLAIAKSLGATQAEVGVMASVGLQLSTRMKEVETIEFNRDKSLGITVFIDQRKGSASTTDTSGESLRSTVEAAINLAKLTQPDPFSGLAEPHEMAKGNKNLDLYHPWDLSVEQAIDLVKNCEAHALALDKKIVNSDGATLSSSQTYHVYGNSHGFLGYFPTSRHSLSCVMIAQDVQGMERDHEYTVARDPNLLWTPEKVGKGSAERALRRLSAKKLPTQRIPVLFHATMASGILSHFIGAISGGRLFRQSSFLVDSLHKKIFPEHIHIYERPHLPGGMSSSPYDSDGVATSDKDYIKDGIVQNYVLSAYSSRKLKLPNTGNAGGVNNLFIAPGNEDFDALIKKMGRGLIVTELMGQGVNMVTGDYSRGASGFWVENGVIQYPVHEITIAGNLRDIFARIVAVGNDVDTRGGIQSGSILIEEMTLAGV